MGEILKDNFFSGVKIKIETKMSAKNSHTTADVLPWDSAISLIHRLYKDGDYRMSLLIATGIFTGLRITDIRAFRWHDLMGSDIIEVIEHKTKKHREIKLNHDYMKHVKDCYDALHIKNPQEHCFLTQKQTVISIQWINRRFKEIRTKYRVPIKNFTTHSMRKGFSRRIFDMSGDDKTMSLLLLSECLGHSNTNITKRYIGLKTEQILNTYDLLSF